MIGYTNCHTAASQKQFNPQLYEEAVYEKKDKPDKKRSGGNAICLHGIRCGTDSGRGRGK